MKKLLLIALLLVSVPAMAEEAATTPAAASEAHKEGAGPGMKGKSFEEHKAKILKRMEEHAAEAQKRRACVEAAATPEALKACMPERMKNRKRRSGQEDAPEAGDAPAHQ